MSLEKYKHLTGEMVSWCRSLQYKWTIRTKDGEKKRKPRCDDFMIWNLVIEGVKFFSMTPQEASDRTKNQTRAAKLQSCAITTWPEMPVKY